MEDKNVLVKYWMKTAEHDYDTMLSLFKSRDIPTACFTVILF